jgi:lipid-binding SYLF domain-containing protein
MALVTGWNRSTWNSGTWNSPLPVEVTGVSAASAVGSVTTVSLPVSVSVTGVSAASAIGTATATGVSNVSNGCICCKCSG